MCVVCIPACVCARAWGGGGGGVNHSLFENSPGNNSANVYTPLSSKEHFIRKNAQYKTFARQNLPYHAHRFLRILSYLRSRDVVTQVDLLEGMCTKTERSIICVRQQFIPTK